MRLMPAGSWASGHHTHTPETETVPDLTGLLELALLIGGEWERKRTLAFCDRLREGERQEFGIEQFLLSQPIRSSCSLPTLEGGWAVRDRVLSPLGSQRGQTPTEQLSDWTELNINGVPSSREGDTSLRAVEFPLTPLWKGPAPADGAGFAW